MRERDESLFFIFMLSHKLLFAVGGSGRSQSSTGDFADIVDELVSKYFWCYRHGKTIWGERRGMASAQRSWRDFLEVSDCEWRTVNAVGERKKGGSENWSERPTTDQINEMFASSPYQRKRRWKGIYSGWIYCSHVSIDARSGVWAMNASLLLFAVDSFSRVISISLQSSYLREFSTSLTNHVSLACGRILPSSSGKLFRKTRNTKEQSRNLINLRLCARWHGSWQFSRTTQHPEGTILRIQSTWQPSSTPSLVALPRAHPQEFFSFPLSSPNRCLFWVM